jgi:hypothetical protein
VRKERRLHGSGRNVPFFEGKVYGEYAGKSHGYDNVSKRDITKFHDALDINRTMEDFKSGLSAVDFEILDALEHGEKPRQAAKRLGVNVRHINYRTNIMRQQIREQLNLPAQKRKSKSMK